MIAAGDYDVDGDVDDADYDFWKTNFGATTGAGLAADGNGNGVVDEDDYTIWRDNVGSGAGAVEQGAGSTEQGGVGWVEFRETHQFIMTVGLAKLDPPYQPQDLPPSRAIRPQQAAAAMLSGTARRDDALVAWLAARDDAPRKGRDADAFVRDLPSDATSATELDVWDAVYERLEAIGAS